MWKTIQKGVSHPLHSSIEVLAKNPSYTATSRKQATSPKSFKAKTLLSLLMKSSNKVESETSK